MRKINSAELICNPDGSIYHLGLHPHQVANCILTVGDPDRVDAVAAYFDTITHQQHKREFKTVTGTYKGKALTVMSTGMGTDNIDIALNELDALFNVHLDDGSIKEEFTPLTVIRLGTSGTLRPEIPVDSLLLSSWAVGVDALLSFYAPPEASEFTTQVAQFFKNTFQLPTPYTFAANPELLQHFSSTHLLQGVTITHPGFYGPQGRQLRLPIRFPNWIEQLQKFKALELEFTNFDMETAGIYALAQNLGHRALSVNAILANRATGVFSAKANETVDAMIRYVLNRCVSLPH